MSSKKISAGSTSQSAARSTGVKVTWTINGQSGVTTFQPPGLTQPITLIRAYLEQGGTDSFQMNTSLLTAAEPMHHQFARRI